MKFKGTWCARYFKASART